MLHMYWICSIFSLKTIAKILKFKIRLALSYLFYDVADSEESCSAISQTAMTQTKWDERIFFFFFKITHFHVKVMSLLSLLRICGLSGHHPADEEKSDGVRCHMSMDERKTGLFSGGNVFQILRPQASMVNTCPILAPEAPTAMARQIYGSIHLQN